MAGSGLLNPNPMKALAVDAAGFYPNPAKPDEKTPAGFYTPDPAPEKGSRFWPNPEPMVDGLDTVALVYVGN